MKIFSRKKQVLKKIIYPTIFGIFIIFGIFVFVYSVKFLSGSINDAFYIDNKMVESKMIKVDLDKLKEVASKLNIKLGETAVDVSPFSGLSAHRAGSSSSGFFVSSASSSSIIQLDKKLVKIAIYNSTKKKGLAMELKDAMIKDGFVINKTGNVSEIAGTTTVKIKNNKKDYLPLIKESVSKKYATIEDKELNEESEYDIIITIGGRD